MPISALLRATTVAQVNGTVALGITEENDSHIYGVLAPI